MVETFFQQFKTIMFSFSSTSSGGAFNPQVFARAIAQSPGVTTTTNAQVASPNAPTLAQCTANWGNCRTQAKEYFDEFTANASYLSDRAAFLDFLNKLSKGERQAAAEIAVDAGLGEGVRQILMRLLKLAPGVAGSVAGAIIVFFESTEAH